MLESIIYSAPCLSLVTNHKLANGKKKIQSIIKCCSSKRNNGGPINYYQVLGVGVDSSRQEIKEAYRRLQKQHHPDIAGDEGHEYTLLLNEAYKALISNKRKGFEEGSNFFNRMGYSSWNGPIREQALFVDENKCIGCRECVHHASKTFCMDEVLGCARVQVQFGDHEKQIEVAMESCPVNCIHWVENDDLPFLEFVMQPQPKEAFGVFGGGWQRPPNVFDAANYLKKQLQNQHDTETTPLASQHMQNNQFQKIWSRFSNFLARE